MKHLMGGFICWKIWVVSTNKIARVFCTLFLTWMLRMPTSCPSGFFFAVHICTPSQLNSHLVAICKFGIRGGIYEGIQATNYLSHPWCNQYWEDIIKVAQNSSFLKSDFSQKLETIVKQIEYKYFFLGEKK